MVHENFLLKGTGKAREELVDNHPSARDLMARFSEVLVLWALLKLTSSLVFLIAAIQAARQAHAGFVTVALCVTVGLVVGVCNLLGMTALEQKIERYTAKLSSAEAERRLRAMYLAAFLWIIFAAYIADRLTRFVIQHA